MAIYRKKPIEIEALQFKRSNEAELKSFTNGAVGNIFTVGGVFRCKLSMGLKQIVLEEGDYVIKHSDGSFGVQIQRTFESQYEKVPETK